ncbi:hypothetical protein DYB37_003710 [Aphanomyces astaci]|uniref:Lysosomal Pro-X carboxypeptidase n=1 Tax=Aphanomyces astaci TaxID=112090 RepID=A0A397BNQ7_APHAT|nr:hypothetical protein DYB25_001863 [Aphanomyces astaci]RHY84933.1 hypothetical protein DYB26_007106 [Aphanomyces astaci]RHZ03003.1 hypothetical protein DYB35_003948 [Aphanomyces astaci]RHZ07042.1 hypothetical protein DYB37_003710 [Aphanomyces astaci]
MSARSSTADEDSRLPILEKYTEESKAAATRQSTWTKSLIVGGIVLLVAGIAYAFGSSTNAPDTSLYARDFTGDLRQNCTEAYITQPLNQFGATGATYDERYFVCAAEWTQGGPIFFYTGNEANVELYLNHTGIMWENAAEFGAMLVFAEHRYFGLSIPDDALKRMEYLSSEQALADYAVLLGEIKNAYNASSSAVVAFGGSYGGMLATWFRQKYPHVVDGTIAGSAPVLAFEGQSPAADTGSFSRIVTFDATPAAGAAANCVPNIKSVWGKIAAAARTAAGRDTLARAFGFCESFATESAALGLVDWIQGAFAFMAMGNYPYPSSYLMNGVSVMPAYPVRVACAHLADLHDDDDVALFHAVKLSVGVFYNTTFDKRCYTFGQPSNESQHDNDFWDYLSCSEMYMPMDQGGGANDFYMANVHNISASNASCLAEWNVPLRPTWAHTVYGGRAGLEATSNIVFTNGNYDPWSGTGVLTSVSESVVALHVDGGAHHLDFMFSHPLDTQSVKDVRNEQKKHMAKWIDQAATKRRQRAAVV